MLGIQADVNLSHLMAATIAWGDINYTLGNWPFDVHAGLNYSSGRDVRPANSAAWRAVLESGDVRPAVVTGGKLYDTPPVQIRQLQIRG